MIDWLIIGGGIHGTYLGNLLTGQLGVRRDDVRVLDPNHAPNWRDGPLTHKTVGCAICVPLQLTILILTSFLSF